MPDLSAVADAGRSVGCPVVHCELRCCLFRAFWLANGSAIMKRVRASGPDPGASQCKEEAEEQWEEVEVESGVEMCSWLDPTAGSAAAAEADGDSEQWYTDTDGWPKGEETEEAHAQEYVDHGKHSWGRGGYQEKWNGYNGGQWYKYNGPGSRAWKQSHGKYVDGGWEDNHGVKSECLKTIISLCWVLYSYPGP